MRQQGHTFRTIARDIPIWEENDPKKTPLTPSELKAWYEKETIRRKLRLCQQLFLKGGGASTTPYSKR